MEALERRDTARKQLEGVFQSLKEAIDEPSEGIPISRSAWAQGE